MKFIKIILILSIVSINIKAQKYDDIYYNMSNKTLSQSYCDLLNYQKSNPYFANSYIQLAVICEQKMILTDPLLEINETQFWADNALLSFDNFDNFYRDNDLRSNYEYYENLKIKYNGNQIKEADLLNFVKQHKTFCKNFKDSTLLAYNAIESSKSHYDKCIQIFNNICSKYNNLNEALLRYDNNLKNTLKELSDNFDIAINDFNKYKSIIKAFPIANHRQLFDYKDIKEYRLDGITNTDFYENRFTIWNYRKWIDDYNNQLNRDIIPLRNRIKEINDKYTNEYNVFKLKKKIDNTTENYFDEKLIQQLGQYDQQSLVRELFSYFENRRQYILLATDSLSNGIDTIIAHKNIKLNHIYRSAIQICNAQRALQNMNQYITNDNIENFKDFFNNEYGGISGLKKYKETENEFFNKSINEQINNFNQYLFIIDKLHNKQTYSIKTKCPAIPLWIVNDKNSIDETYRTSKILYDSNGAPMYVAGIKDAQNKTIFIAHINKNNETEWLTEIKNSSEIKAIVDTENGCFVYLNQNELPVCIELDKTGKQTAKYDINDGEIPSIIYDRINNVTYTSYNTANTASVCKNDLTGNKIWNTLITTSGKIIESCSTTKGLIILSTNNNNTEISLLSTSGNILKNKVLSSEKIEINYIYKASANEICILCNDTNNKPYIIIVTDDLEIKYTSKE